jgi:hypothetical protein
MVAALALPLHGKGAGKIAHSKRVFFELIEAFCRLSIARKEMLQDRKAQQPDRSKSRGPDIP